MYRVYKNNSISIEHSCFHVIFPHLFIGQPAAVSKASLVIGWLFSSFDTSHLPWAFEHVALCKFRVIEIRGLEDICCRYDRKESNNRKGIAAFDCQSVFRLHSPQTHVVFACIIL